MKPLVLIAYYYPPLSGVAAERAAALARHIGALGWTPIVVTSRGGHFHSAPSTGPAVRVERTGSVELSRVFRSGYASTTGRALDPGGALTPVQAGGVGGALRRWVREHVYVPDAQVGWIPFVVRAATDLVGELDETPVILSTSVPYSAHVAAMWVARRFDLPWVAELRDPWTTCHPSLRPRSPLRRAVDHRTESAILRAADAVVVTSRTTRAGLLDAHPGLRAHKVDVVYNGFEPPSGPPDPPAPAEPLDVLYAGTVAPGVSVAPTLEAFATVSASAGGGIRLRVLGPPEAWTDAADRMSVCTDWLSCEGIVSPEEAREAMVRSSVNLLLLPGDAHRDRIPGKLFEYLGAGRPILAVVPAESEMETLAREYGDVRIVNRNTAREIAPALSASVAEHRAGDLQARQVPGDRVVHLTREAQAGKMCAVLERTLALRSRA